MTPFYLLMGWLRGWIIHITKGTGRQIGCRAKWKGGETALVALVAASVIFPGGASSASSPVFTPAHNRLIAKSMAAQAGWTGPEWTALDKLIQGESQYVHTARNRRSGAFGIAQALPGTKMASFGSDWQTNPATQIGWMLGYVRNRYGTPAKAYRTWLSRSPHWY